MKQNKEIHESYESTSIEFSHLIRNFLPSFQRLSKVVDELPNKKNVPWILEKISHITDEGTSLLDLDGSQETSFSKKIESVPFDL